ncbi:MAG: saccharopine dehydrogenase NADP-binding domain-containing protein [Deltaproteobacteria bacterium]|nr:MAG: saccharopine dehydrogenase NADP-binding domain-containing protein [Deltaproteobacteria bacterium]
MAKITVLGGCGSVGSVAVKTLAPLDYFSEIVIGDINIERAKEIVSGPGSNKVSAVKVDARDSKSVKKAIKGSDVVLNCAGPFHKLVPIILKAVIESRVNYLDICDDVDVTVEIMKMDEAAREAGVTALIGMGSSPGATNLLAKFAADSLLDETDSIDIFHAHGGEPFEGEGVVEHRLHCINMDIPMFLDGELKHVRYFEEDGIALREEFDFPVLGKVLLYPYAHPEQVTLPRYIKCRQVTNKGTQLPEEYSELIRELCRLGLAGKEPIKVKGQEVVPYDFIVAYIIRERERILKKTGFGPQRGCASVIVKGKKDGEYREYRFHMASRTQAMGEGTAIPAAAGAILMLRGKVSAKGVIPPEACVEPQEFIDLIPEVMKLDEKKEGGESFGGVIVEQIDEDGRVTKLDI